MKQKVKTLSVYLATMLDIVMILIAYAVANILRFDQAQIQMISSANYTVLLWFVIITYIAVQLFFRTNIEFLSRGTARELYLVIKQYVLVAVCVMVYFYIVKIGHDFSRLQLGYFFVIATVLTFIEHLLLKCFLKKQFIISNAEKMVVITDSSNVKKVVAELKKNIYLSVENIIVVDKDMTGETIQEIPVSANASDMEEFLRNTVADCAYIHISHDVAADTDNIMRWLTDMGIKIYLHLHEYDLDYGMKRFGTLGKYGVITYSNYEYVMRDVIIKRIMDIAAGLILFIAMCIAFPFVALGIMIQAPGPIFFKQTRIGKNGRRFDIYKFRSMYMDAEERKAELMKQNEMGSDFMFKMKDDPRIFPIGKLIRKLSIDELPQAINILKGDMSLVGTRPPTEKEFELYENYHRRRVSIKPGLTGMWQVSGRSSITDFDDIVKLDCEYIDNWNLRLDLKIIAKTVWVVLFGRGAE